MFTKHGFEMQRIFFAVTMALLLSACTKEVPENDKKLTKSVDEKNIQETIDNYYSALNSGDIEKAASFVDYNFRGVLQDMSEIIGINSFTNNLRLAQKKFLGWKWEIKFNEINVFGDYAYSITSASILVNNKAIKKLNDVCSEKAIRILKRQKNGGWKIFRFIAVQDQTK
jgi:ketosteroid isomerase-like protein